MRNVYRGHVISLKEERLSRLEGPVPPAAGDRSRGDHPARRAARTDRAADRGLFARHRDRLLGAGRHLKRGLLLHGPPGTGKTLTVMYLAAAMCDRTVLLMTGRNLGLIGRTCAMARALQPSIVVLEDVDLIAEERTKGGSGCATAPLRASQRDGRVVRRQRYRLHPDDQSPGPARAGLGVATRPGGPGDRDPAARRGLPRRLFTLYGQG